MVSLKKYIPCKCGANNSFDFSSDMQVEDLTLSARCSLCGSSVTVSVSALLQSTPQSPVPPLSPSPEQPTTPASVEISEKETKENVEQAVRDIFRY